MELNILGIFQYIIQAKLYIVFFRFTGTESIPITRILIRLLKFLQRRMWTFGNVIRKQDTRGLAARTQARAEFTELCLNWRWLVLFWNKDITNSEHSHTKTNEDGRKLSVNFELCLCKQSGQQIALFTSVNH